MAVSNSVFSSPLRGILLAVLLSGIFTEYAVSEEPTHDEKVAAEVTEGLNLSAGVAAALMEFYYEYERFPNDNREAGVTEPNEIRGRFVNSVSIGPGTGEITIEYGNYADPIISGATLIMSVEIRESRRIWTCSSQYISERYFPKDCGLRRSN